MKAEMISYIEKPIAFIWRDFIDEATYKLAFIMQFFSIFISILTLYFVSKLLGDVGVAYLNPYGGDYFSFVLIGVAFYSYLGVSMKEVSSVIREGQMLGTLEALLVTQTNIPTIIISSSFYSFIWATFQVLTYLILGTVFFGINLENSNIISALTILILTIISFSSIGIISASFIMILKKGDPVSWIIGAASTLLGGLYYPISVLPDWLQKISYLLPVTYSLEAMRLSLLKGHSLVELGTTVTALLAFAIVMLPFSIFVFNYAVKKAKIDGSLTHY